MPCHKKAWIYFLATICFAIIAMIQNKDSISLLSG